MAGQTQAVPPSDGDLDEPVGGSPAAGSPGAPDGMGSDREAFLRFQRFLRLEREQEGRGLRGRRRQRDDEEEEDGGGDGRGSAGPPPSWDGVTPFEDYFIKAKLWIATTKAKGRSRGPLLLKMLSGAPFEHYKHWAKDPEWMADPHGAERLLNDMDTPEKYGDDQQEHMLTAMSRITYHLRRQRNETWREYFAKWDGAIRKVHQHKITLPEEYEGFLMINGLQLTETETKAMLNYTHGCIKPSSIKSWLRKNETRLSAAELGTDKKKNQVHSLTEFEGHHIENNDIEENDEDKEEIDELEQCIMHLQDDADGDTVLSEGEAAEILSTYVQQKKTYTQSIKNKKARELARGYGKRPPPGGYDRGSVRDRPLRPGSYSVTIAELQKRTRCRNCGQIGHWKRDCKNPPQKNPDLKTNESHYLENTDEAFFIGHLAEDVLDFESDPTILEANAMNLATRSPTSTERHGETTPLSPAGRNWQPKVGSATDAERPSASAYMESDLFRPTGVEHLFVFENMFCNLVSKSPQPQDMVDATCATVDTGCQRLAIGARTLREFAQHLPEPLKITLTPETNRFRSVHQTSVTSKVATIPCSLGTKGSFLKPAVFENEESSGAPFLISLSFLLHCHGEVILCHEQGLQLRLRGTPEPVPLHLGPTGALRIPLQQYNQMQKQALEREQNLMNQSTSVEFEVLKLQDGCMEPPKPSTTQATSPFATPHSAACHANRWSETCSGQSDSRRRRPSTASSSSIVVPPDETISTGSDAPSADAGKVHGPYAQHQATPRGPEGDDSSPTRRRSTDDPECGPPGNESARRYWSSTSGTRTLVQPQRDQHPSSSSTTTSSRSRPHRKVSADQQPTRHRDDLGTTSEVSLRPSVQDPPQRLGPDGTQLREVVLSMPPGTGTSVPLRPVVRPAASSESGKLASPATARRRTCELHTDLRGHDPNQMSTQGDTSKGFECLSHQGHLSHVQQGHQVREDRENGRGKQVQGQHDVLKLGPTITPGDSLSSDSPDHIGWNRPGAPDRLPGISRIPSLEKPTTTSETGGTVRQVTPKLERKLRAAIKKATAFWRELQLLLADTPLQHWAQVLNDEICQEFTLNPAGTKRSREIAEVMGLTVKQLKTVAEVYNPGCFQKITGRFHLSPGRAFDLSLGDDLLNEDKQNEVMQYVKVTKPGLVCIAPPCKMYTQLQNLSKEKRARLPDLMKRYLKNKAEGDRLLIFAIRLCEFCDELGIKFIFEHPHAASSWKHCAMERLLDRPNVIYTKADQCQYGLQGQSGLPQRKRTGFATNSEAIAQALSKLCPGNHEHEVTIGGNRSQRSQVYPEKLRSAILKAYSQSINVDHVEVVSSESMLAENHRLNYLMDTEFRALKDLQREVPAGHTECQDPDSRALDEPDSRLPDLPDYVTAEILANEENRGPHDRENQEDDGELQPEEEQEEGETPENPEQQLPLHSRFPMERLLHRAHVGLGHPTSDRFVRILRYAKAKPEVIEAAKHLRCSVCQRHSQVKPARRSAPPKELAFNECVGVDVIFLPTLGSRSRPALNVIDWSSKFQLMIPMDNKKPGHVREAYRHWLRLFGPPKRMALDLGREFRGTFAEQAEQDGTFVDPSAVEAPHQRGITERHGKTFKYLLQKTMDTYSCANMKEWEEMVDITMMTKNRMMNVGGFSPSQRVLGFNPFLPGGLLNGDDGHRGQQPEIKVGDLSIERSMKLRKAAAHAFIEADASNSLRRAVASGPRPVLEYDIGEIVYFFRMGADKKLKFKPCYWHGPARIIMIDQPSTIWLSYQSQLVKASPERIRRASMEENMAMSGWLEDLVKLKKDITTEPIRGFLDLSDQPLPEIMDDEDNHEEYTPTEPDEVPDQDIPMEPVLPPGLKEPLGYPRPAKRYREKGPQDELVYDDREPLPAVPDDQQSGDRQQDEADLRLPEPEQEREKRAHDEDELDEQPSKRSRLEYLETYLLKVENLIKGRQRKEVRLQELNLRNQKCFKNAIRKEIQNNINIGAYTMVSPEESARVRQTMPNKIMESRLVLTPKPLEPHEIEKAKEEEILLDWETDEPCKAKARHVMKGFSEEGAENIEATTPQVTREGTLTVAQLVSSFQWRLGFLDFTQAFHSGDPIERLLYATQPREGIPGMNPGQLLKLEKVCYGLTDGPLAWYNHLRKFLVGDLHYQQSLADPCIYYKLKTNLETGKEQLSGIIAVATDDLLHGGDHDHEEAMNKIQTKYKLGKFQYGAGKFTGKLFTQHDDYSITVNQENYVQEKLFEIHLEKSRKKRRFSFCDDKEVSSLRASVGALAWLAKESRPDIAGRVALLQQVFPRPRIKDIIEANSITQEAKKYATSGIRIMPIAPGNLRVGVATDASWSNARSQDQIEKDGPDYWEEKSQHWIRHHLTPRRTLFHPGATPGPDLHDLQPGRRTVNNLGNTKEDDWTRGNSTTTWDSQPWTGQTIFTKQLPGHELEHSHISDCFLKMLNCSSQGGYVLMFYDKRMESENQPHMVSVTSWKSSRLKRKTVNTLSAECQALIQGIGQIHWHRYLLLELLGAPMSTTDWERHLASIPYVSVVDSRSLYDCINKLVCTYAQVEDKRTAIDVAILKDDLCRSGGTLRWVAGDNMVADPLTKRMCSDFLRMICNTGMWSLSEDGHERQCTEQDVLIVSLCR